MTEIEETIIEWNSCAVEIETAVADRNFEKFREIFRKGNSCFRKIRTVIEKGEVQKLKDIRLKVEQAVAEWKKVSGQIPAWMAEMKAEIQKRKDAASRDKRLNNAYNYTKNTGNKLKVKAR